MTILSLLIISNIITFAIARKLTYNHINKSFTCQFSPCCQDQLNTQNNKYLTTCATKLLIENIKADTAYKNKLKEFIIAS